MVIKQQIATFVKTHNYPMEYINEFHKEWIERTRQSIVSWSKQPVSPEEVRKQQEKLNQQKAIREDRLKNL